MLYYIGQFLIASFATLGFTFYFYLPKNMVAVTSIFSGIAWVIYKVVVSNYNNYFLAGFLSAFALGIIGECASRIMKKPATLFILPGFIPMVPGAGMYYSMYYLIYQDYSKFVDVTIQTFYIAASLAIGIVFALNVVKFFVLFKKIFIYK